MKLFDLHCDTATAIYDNGAELRDNKMAVDLKYADRYENYVQVYAIFINDNLRGKKAYDYYENTLRYIKNQFTKYNVKKYGTGARLQGIVSVEGGAAIAGNIDNLYKMYDHGVRILTFTWNGECELGYGHEKNKGLKPFGKDVAKKCLEIGVIPDVSHLSEKGFWDLCDEYSKPFIATHSNSKKVYKNTRNLTNKQLKEIFLRGGLCGINYYKGFLAGESSSVDDVYRHIYYMLNLGGQRSIALGSDFDGADIPCGFDRLDKVSIIYEYLLSKNIEEDIVKDIFYNNAKQFFDIHLGELQ